MSIIDISKQENVNYRTLYYGLKRNGFDVDISLTDKRSFKANDTYFESIDNAEKAYVYGLLLADGCLNFSKSTPRITLKLQSGDEELVEKIRDLLSPGKTLYEENYIYKNKPGKSVKLEVCSTKIADDLMKWGFTERKTGNTKFPSFSSYMSHFIRGYFDGNGSISKNGEVKANCYLCSADYSFLSAMEEVLRSCNIDCIIYTEKRQGLDMHRLAIRSGSLKLFFQYMYEDSTLHLNRKYSKYANIVVTRDLKLSRTVTHRD